MTQPDNPVPSKPAILGKWRDCLSEVARGAATGIGGAADIAVASSIVGIVASIAGIAGIDSTDIPAAADLTTASIGGVFLLGAGFAYAAGFACTAAARVVVKRSTVKVRPLACAIGAAIPFAVSLGAGAESINIFAHNIVSPEPRVASGGAGDCGSTAVQNAIAEIQKSRNVRITCTRPGDDLASPSPAPYYGPNNFM